MNKTKLNLLFSISSLCLMLCLFVVTLFAWYTSNNNVSTSQVVALTSNNKNVIFEPTVQAVRTKLDGQIITETYTVSTNGSKLYLINRLTVDGEGNTVSNETFQESQHIAFKIFEILPSEYVDITIGYYLQNQNNTDYHVSFNNITGGAFEVEGLDTATQTKNNYVHYATGAFQYKSISLKDANDQDVVDFSSEEFEWINSYNITQDDETNIDKTLLTHTWSDDYQKLYYTFRIVEDFSQFYELISKSTQSYGALLSDLEVTIENIYFSI